MNQHNPCPAGNRSGAPTDTKQNFSLMLPIARAQMGVTRKALGIWGNWTSVAPSWGSLVPVRSAQSIPAWGSEQRPSNPRSPILPSSHLQTVTDPEHLPLPTSVSIYSYRRQSQKLKTMSPSLLGAAEPQVHEHREQQRAPGGLLPGPPRVLPPSCTLRAASAQPDTGSGIEIPANLPL